MNHDVTTCREAICPQCIAFEDGYARGKAKARFELEVWDGLHARGCECENCRIARGILARVPGPLLNLPGAVQ